MLQSKYLSPLSGKKFETHGVKEIEGLQTRIEMLEK